MNLPASENALLLRTDFTHPTAWQELLAAAREPEEPFGFYLEVLDDPAHSGWTPEQVRAALPEDYGHSFIVLADQMAMAAPGHPVLVVDLFDEPGRRFRAAANQIAAIDSNLSIGNLSFEEFAEQVDESAVFRGFPSGD